MKSLKDQSKKLKEKKEKKNDETIEEVQEQKTPRLIPKPSEEEPELDKLV